MGVKKGVTTAAKLMVICCIIVDVNWRKIIKEKTNFKTMKIYQEGKKQSMKVKQSLVPSSVKLKKMMWTYIV